VGVLGVPRTAQLVHGRHGVREDLEHALPLGRVRVEQVERLALVEDERQRVGRRLGVQQARVEPESSEGLQMC
jgi:hypothetical protein